METFQTLLDAYVAELATKHTERNNREYPALQKTYGEYNTFTVANGQRFAKIVINSGGQNSVHCFIDKTNGDILKAASWKAPQKNGVRGNLKNENKPVFAGDFYKGR